MNDSNRAVRREASAVRAAVIAALGLGATLPVAQAQESGAARGLEEVVVTARKREEVVQETPVSMVAFTAEGLQRASIDTFKDLANAAPNLEINGGIPNGGGSATQIFIRGVGQDDYSFPNEPGVGLYIDDVYIARSAGGDFGFLDIERIEVLRGPQGTLYGRNTIGGAVKVMTVKPDGEFGGEVSLTAGDYERLDGYASLRFPLTDTISGSVGVAKNTRDGLGENLRGQELGERDQELARGALRFQPSDALDVMFRADWMQQRQAGPAGSMVQFVPNGATEGLINPLLAPSVADEFNLQPPYDTYGAAWVKSVDRDGHGVYDSGGAEQTRDWAEIWGTSLTVDYAVSDALDLKSITAYRSADIDIRRDSEHTPFRIVRVDNPEDTSQLTQEFQLNGSSLGNRLEWVVGLFGLKEEGDSTLYAPLLQGTFELIGLDLEAFIETEYDAYSIAAFGEGTYAVNDRLGITLGMRVTHDNKEYIYSLYRPPSDNLVLPPTTLKDDWTEFLPKLGVEFQSNDDLLLYGSVSRGYKAGGYNSRALSGNPPKAYDPEFITAYELGFKSEWADNRVILNGAVFYNDYTDIQLLSVLDLGGGNVETVIENAAAGRVIGGELELTALPVPELQLGIGIGVLDTKYDEVDDSAASAGITEDNTFINAPDFSANVSADYTVDLGGVGSLLFHVDGVYRDEQYRNAANTESLRSDSYAVLNGRITFGTDDGKWEVSAFMTNMTDEIYITNGVEVLGLGYVEAYYSRPREWGATVRYRFD